MKLRHPYERLSESAVSPVVAPRPRHHDLSCYSRTPRVLDAELVRPKLVLTQGRIRPGVGRRHADPDRRPGLRGRRDRRHRRHEDGDGEELPGLAHGRCLHGGVGKRSLPGASSSGQTITFLPSCHWNITILCAIWNPSRSTRNAPKTALWSIFRMASRSLSAAAPP